MPTHSEVVRLNLEYYRKQAKALLRASKAGAAGALQRLRRHWPAPGPGATSQAGRGFPALHDAQLAIAREQGFPSWPRFKAFIVESRLNFQELVAAFIDAAVSDGKRAEEILAAHPKIADAGLYVALVLGDAKRVEQALTGTGVDGAVSAADKSGPQNCEPLLYVCFSRFANGKSARAQNFADTARVLLRHGADPNTSFPAEHPPHSRLSCLYAAAGLNNNPAMTLALLEAGADPNDGESLYHSTEQSDLTCMKLLLRFGAKTDGSNALKHILDREDLEGLQLLQAAGANPNETNERAETALHWAIWRGRSVKAVAALVDHGADIHALRQDGRSAYAMAFVSGQAEVAAFLAERGAKTELSPLDQFVGACAHADPAELDRLLSTPPPNLPLSGNHRLLSDLAAEHRTSAVRGLLAAGMPVDARGEWGGTALHWACWKGYADLVELLIEHGAPLETEDHEFHAPPSGWMHHGTINCCQGDGNYARVARLLVAAGASMKDCDTATGNPEVDAVLREHKLIA